MKTLRRLLPVAALVAAAAAGCSQQGQPPRGPGDRQPAPHLVELFTVAEERVRSVYERTGTLRYRRVVRVFNQEEGRITLLPHYEGDRVQAGDLLVRMEDDLLRAELDKAEAATLQARLDLERLENLVARRAASEDELARTRTALNIAVAERRLLQTRLAYTRITAPFDGLVTARLAEPGDVAARHSHLLTLSDPGSLVTEIHVSELLLPHLRAGDPAAVRIDALGSARFDGRILRIHPELDAVSRQGVVEVVLEPVPDGARAGQFARVTLETREVPRLLVPFQAVKRDQRGEFVYRIDEASKVHRVPVRSGMRVADMIEILEGLAPGERIVQRGFLGLAEGRTVTPAGAPAASDESGNENKKQ